MSGRRERAKNEILWTDKWQKCLSRAHNYMQTVPHTAPCAKHTTRQRNALCVSPTWKCDLVNFCIFHRYFTAFYRTTNTRPCRNLAISVNYSPFSFTTFQREKHLSIKITLIYYRFFPKCAFDCEDILCVCEIRGSLRTSAQTDFFLRLAEMLGGTRKIHIVFSWMLAKVAVCMCRCALCGGSSATTHAPQINEKSSHCNFVGLCECVTPAARVAHQQNILWGAFRYVHGGEHTVTLPHAVFMLRKYRVPMPFNMYEYWVYVTQIGCLDTWLGGYYDVARSFVYKYMKNTYVCIAYA